MAFQSINPATEEVEATLDEHSPEEVEQALADVWQAFEGWRKTSLGERSRLMQAAARHLRANKERYAGLMTAEMGKPIKQSEAEVEKCAWNCDFYAEHTGTFLGDRDTPSSATQSYVAFDPLGPVLAVMPWNFPFWQVFRFAVPAIMAGNSAVLKHASNVPRSALAIEEVFREAGFPDGIFRTLLIPSGKVAPIIEDDRIRAVTLTGSDFAGSKVAEVSGRALKKNVLELGGSDPFIVLADADLEAAATTAVNARYQNAGQSCIAAKRFIVEDGVADEFTGLFVEAAQRLRLGDPAEHETELGPVARGDLLDDLEDQVKRSIGEGADIVAGGHRIERKGYFYAPTVVSNVSRTMPVFAEETFGPVAAVVRARDAEDAVALANESQYGLGSALWTRDIERGRSLARDIESGSVFINGMVASDPRLPFGGVKRSGYGRELGEFGIREFVNIKTVWIGPAREQATTPPTAE
ncbi:MAG: aldehyde dehydrogenase family protein [Dehalococcoidia bacterium]|nr:aldehyde dehydrogenase family protein [Dehalococcoidia bacterium]